MYEPENDFSKNIITAKVPLFGTANNKVVIVTYTDTECPFCKLLHENVISKIKDEYKNITVYYNYLQFHNKSLEESEAVYCVNKYYPEKYYLYVDKLFRSTSGNDSLEYNTLLTMATSLDIDANKIDTCIKNDEVKTHTDNDAQDGIDKEIRGTPFTYILIRNGENYNVFAKISGARDYDYFNKILNKAISL
ncbi:MAG: thioredoxin domain-containing protein [Cyanobium sp. MAG06]|nr:thioredoxin domain-containing protein [Cyanobium sp. MAG06]